MSGMFFLGHSVEPPLTIRLSQSDVTELNCHGSVFNELTNGQARRVCWSLIDAYNSMYTVGLQHQQQQQQQQRVTMSKCAAQRLVIADANRTLEVAICNDKRRQRHLYTSAGNDVTVYVKYSSRYAAFAANSPVTFILHYQGMIMCRPLC